MIRTPDLVLLSSRGTEVFEGEPEVGDVDVGTVVSGIGVGGVGLRFPQVFSRRHLTLRTKGRRFGEGHRHRGSQKLRDNGG